MKKRRVILLSLVAGIIMCPTSYAAQTIVAQKVGQTPAVDGNGNDPVWEKSKAIISHDDIGNIDLTLKAVYTDSEIFFLVTFPDKDESREHKTYVWDKVLELYRTGLEREDSFVFKWNMESRPVDLSVRSDKTYEADIWFWKAHRTDPIGYADDKQHILSFLELSDSRKQISKRGKVFYLARLGDKGSSAYQAKIYEDYVEDRLSKFDIVAPTGSRADIKAKGIWANGQWVIEFGRALNTGHTDDIQFEISKNYFFGVSRYEIGGRDPDPETTQPLFGAGDVSEALSLSFSQ